MKILPKKQDLDKAKSLARKQEIDEGVALAKRIDVLRETVAREEKNLLDYKAITVKEVQGEIIQLVEEKESIERQVNEAIKERDRLLKPLTAEWALVNDTKTQIAEEKQSIWEEKEILEKKKQETEKEKEEIATIITKIKKNEEETEKAKGEATSLKEMAQREYEMANEEHIKHTEIEEKAMVKALELQKEYEVGVKTNQIKENDLKQKESELIIREKDLERQQANAKRAYEAYILK